MRVLPAEPVAGAAGQPDWLEVRKAARIEDALVVFPLHRAYLRHCRNNKQNMILILMNVIRITPGLQEPVHVIGRGASYCMDRLLASLA